MSSTSWTELTTPRNFCLQLTESANANPGNREKANYISMENNSQISGPLKFKPVWFKGKQWFHFQSPKFPLALCCQFAPHSWPLVTSELILDLILFPFPEYTRNGIIQYARAFRAWYLLSVTLWGLNLVICIAVWCSVVWCTTAAYLFTRGWTCEWFPVWGFMKKSDIDIYILIFVSLWCFD